MLWEAEHPQDAARKAAEYDAWLRQMNVLAELAGANVQQAEREKRRDALKARGDRCAECDRPFATGDVIYRRGEHGFDGLVLPYCGEHRCAASEGHHNRDAPEGLEYRNCRCPGPGDRNWLKPEPCAYCTRLVCNDRETANPHKFVRDWQTSEEAAKRQRLLAECETPEERWEMGRELPWGPVVRTFCSEDCRGAVVRIEAKAKRLKAQELHRCETCRKEFAGRADAHYCSGACRQKAYRQRQREEPA